MSSFSSVRSPYFRYISGRSSLHQILRSTATEKKSLDIHGSVHRFRDEEHHFGRVIEKNLRNESLFLWPFIARLTAFLSGLWTWHHKVQQPPQPNGHYNFLNSCEKSPIGWGLIARSGERHFFTPLWIPYESIRMSKSREICRYLLLTRFKNSLEKGRRYGHAGFIVAGKWFTEMINRDISSRLQLVRTYVRTRTHVHPCCTRKKKEECWGRQRGKEILSPLNPFSLTLILYWNYTLSLLYTMKQGEIVRELGGHLHLNGFFRAWKPREKERNCGVGKCVESS